MSVSIMLAVTTIEAVEGKNNQSSLFTTKYFSYPLSLSILVKISFSYQRVLKHELNYTVSVRREGDSLGLACHSLPPLLSH